MALEQWEVDLRKQLEGKNIEKPSGYGDTLLMMTLFVVLGAALLLAYDFKTNGYIQKMFRALVFAEKLENTKKEVIPIIEEVAPFIEKKIPSNEINKLKEEIKKNKEFLDKVSSKTQANTDRLSLMGIMMNENFVITRNNYPKEDMIFFNRDWTLNNMPKHISLSEEDKSYLNKYVKPQ
jgi:hypothetical protein